MTDSEGMTVVLGWDALDYELVREFDLESAFGRHATRLETFDNPVIGKPHTYEVWPSIVTGLGPERHGIRVASDRGVDWRNPLAAFASRLAGPVVPKRVRRTVGRSIQNRGAQLDFKRAGYYRRRGISTVFDGRVARSIAVPNHRVEADDELGFALDRGARLAAFLSIEDDENGNTHHRPTVAPSRLEEQLFGETGDVLGVVRAAIQREYDLVFAWLGLLDTVGHLAPAVVDSEPDWQERAYRAGAAWTDELRDSLLPADTLVCVSDHGLRDGTHTHDAFLGANDERVVRGVDSVLDVREALERITPRTADPARPDDPALRDAYACSGRTEARPPEEIKRQLEGLGYL